MSNTIEKNNRKNNNKINIANFPEKSYNSSVDIDALTSNRISQKNKESISSESSYNKMMVRPNKRNNYSMNNETAMSTEVSLVSTMTDYKKSRKDRNGVEIKRSGKKHKITINPDIEIIDVENYKEYNKERSTFFEALSELQVSCTSCRII